MRIYNKEVFKDVIAGTTEVFTPPALNAMLGAAEQHQLQIRASQARGTSPSLTVNLYTSNDGVSWTGGVLGSAQALTVDASTVFFKNNNGSGAPLGAFIRFGFVLSGADNSAHLHVYVTGHAEEQYA